MIDVTFKVDIVPSAAQRVKSRAVIKDGKAMAISNKAASTRKWQELMMLAAGRYLPAGLIDEPVRVDVIWLMPRPGYMDKGRKFDAGMVWHDRKNADRDNLDKNLLDALKPYWRDDCLVCLGTLAKAYHERGGRPSVVVRIRSASLFAPEVVARQVWPEVFDAEGAV